MRFRQRRRRGVYVMYRVPDAVQCSPGDAKHRPVTLLRRAGTHEQSLGPGSPAHHAASHSASKTRVSALVALRSIRGAIASAPHPPGNLAKILRNDIPIAGRLFVVFLQRAVFGRARDKGGL
jgi:hypothetical protein